MEKIKSKLKGIPETMLIPLRARYLETKENNGIINDPKSVEILDQIDYDFSEREVEKNSQKGVSIRTEILDELTNKFISKHKDAVVINLGCGLDTRFHRLNNGSVTWFDLDVPEAIEMRKYFFKETDRFKFISKSVLDFSWTEQIPKNKPTLFIAEGLLMYFTEEEVKSILKTINQYFPNSEIILEAMSPIAGKKTNMQKYNAPFKWTLKTGKDIGKWNIGTIFITEYYYFDRHKNHQPLIFKILSLIPSFRKMIKIVHLKFTN